jgi:hypothetical protein
VDDEALTKEILVKRDKASREYPFWIRPARSSIFVFAGPTYQGTS